MNTPMHFTWKQSVSLASGANTVYLNGGVGTDGGHVPYLTDPTFITMNGTVYVVGINAPAVTFTGTPVATLNPVEIVILSPTTFAWYNGGVLQATGVTITSTYVLGATGVTANFQIGGPAYASGQTYTAYTQWGNAQSKMNVELEFTSAEIATANCQVVGYAFVAETGLGNRNAAAQIVNNAGSSVAVTIVWTYDVFVTNYTVASGSIG